MMDFLWNPGVLAGLTLFSLVGAVLLGRLSWQRCLSLDRGDSLGRWLSFLGAQWGAGACAATFLLAAIRLLARLLGG